MVNEEQVYEDEDDENEEGNWRNDYPDSDNDGDSDREERYVGTLGSAHFLMGLTAPLMNGVTEYVRDFDQCKMLFSYRILGN